MALNHISLWFCLVLLTSGALAGADDLENAEEAIVASIRIFMEGLVSKVTYGNAFHFVAKVGMSLAGPFVLERNADRFSVQLNRTATLFLDKAEITVNRTATLFLDKADEFLETTVILPRHRCFT